MMIFKMMDQFRDEISGVMEYSSYSKKAAEHGDKDLSKMYMNMAKAELEHATELHNHINKLVSDMSDEERWKLMEQLWDHTADERVQSLSDASVYIRE